MTSVLPADGANSSKRFYLNCCYFFFRSWAHFGQYLRKTQESHNRNAETLEYRLEKYEKPSKFFKPLSKEPFEKERCYFEELIPNPLWNRQRQSRGSSKWKYSAVQSRDERPKICVQHACAQFVYTRLRLSMRAFPTRLISMYELAYCPLRVLILLLVLAAVHCKSMAR